MASITQTTDPAPIQMVQLSSFSQRHFDLIKNDNMDDDSFSKNGAKDEITLSEFTFFGRLPQEIQDHIFMLYIALSPSIVYIFPKSNEQCTFHTYCPILNINRKIRAHATAEYGYIRQKVGGKLTLPGFRYPEHSYILHPIMDMIFLGFYMAMSSSYKLLESEVLLSRLRTLAINSEAIYNGTSYLWEILPQMNCLELVLIISESRQSHSTNRRLEMTYIDRKTFFPERVGLEFDHEPKDVDYQATISTAVSDPSVFLPRLLAAAWKKAHGVEKAMPRTVFVKRVTELKQELE